MRERESKRLPMAPLAALTTTGTLFALSQVLDIEEAFCGR